MGGALHAGAIRPARGPATDPYAGASGPYAGVSYWTGPYAKPQNTLSVDTGTQGSCLG
jgi:hypothetical protein